MNSQHGCVPTCIRKPSPAQMSGHGVPLVNIVVAKECQGLATEPGDNSLTTVDPATPAPSRDDTARSPPNVEPQSQYVRDLLPHTLLTRRHCNTIHAATRIMTYEWSPLRWSRTSNAPFGLAALRTDHNLPGVVDPGHYPTCRGSSPRHRPIVCPLPPKTDRTRPSRPCLLPRRRR